MSAGNDQLEKMISDNRIILKTFEEKMLITNSPKWAEYRNRYNAQVHIITELENLRGNPEPFVKFRIPL